LYFMLLLRHSPKRAGIITAQPKRAGIITEPVDMGY